MKGKFKNQLIETASWLVYRKNCQFAKNLCMDLAGALLPGARPPIWVGKITGPPANPEKAYLSQPEAVHSQETPTFCFDTRPNVLHMRRKTSVSGTGGPRFLVTSAGSG
jgi:hypothetical protein